MRRIALKGFSGMPDVGMIAKGIQDAVREHPEWVAHGDTGVRAFFISETGTVLPYGDRPYLASGKEHARDASMVHSHSAENWAYWQDITRAHEPFLPFSDTDMAIFQARVKAKELNNMVLIMGDGRMRILHCPPESEERFTSERQQVIRNKSNPPKKWYTRAKYRGYRWYEVATERQRELARQYGLVLMQNLRWKPEEPKQEPLYVEPRQLKFHDPERPSPEYIYTKVRKGPGLPVKRDLTKEFWMQVPTTAYPVEPRQMELPRVVTIDDKPYAVYEPQPVQARFFGLGGKILNCAGWTFNQEGQPVCFFYEPACKTSKSPTCRTDTALHPKKPKTEYQKRFERGRRRAYAIKKGVRERGSYSPQMERIIDMSQRRTVSIDDIAEELRIAKSEAKVLINWLTLNDLMVARQSGRYAPRIRLVKPAAFGSSEDAETHPQMKYCDRWKLVSTKSNRLPPQVLRCAKYAPACSPETCLTEPAPRPKPKHDKRAFEKAVKDMAYAMAQQFNEGQKEAGPYLAREILSRGGIAPYKKGYLKEEYKEIPLFLKNRKGLPLDEMASEMGLTEAELVAEITGTYRKGQKTVRRAKWQEFETEAFDRVMDLMESGVIEL